VIAQMKSAQLTEVAKIENVSFDAELVQRG
jgi:hypothetical protein